MPAGWQISCVSWTGAAAVASVAGMLVAGLGPWSSSTLRPPERRDVTLLYVGADSCAPCRTWQQGAGAAFRSSAEFAHVTYREVKSPTLLDVLEDEYWPEDLRWYRDRLGRGAGVPLWLLISNDEIVEQGFGASQWHGTVLPKLKSLLRR